MTKAALNSDLAKSKGQVIFEHVLLALCLCVIALRTTFTESPTAQSANLSDSVYSLTVSAVLILSFVVWFVWSFCSRRFLYRFTAIEVGLALFAIAAITAGLAAANKRAAITNFVTLLAPIFMALLLVQILDSYSRIKLLLCVIAALGVVSAYECTEQLLSGNEQLIEFYEQNPEAVLAQQGIVPNSLKHFQFEHRLYSKDIRGFFTTSNSAGSFALLASFAAITLFIERYKNRKSDPLGFAWLITCGIAVAAIIFGFTIARSKGAIVGLVFAVVVFIALLSFGNWIRAHKKAILVVCLLLFVAAGCVVIRYGVTHGRLPGGNSMLVRWQYWHAAAKMYADHPLKGVGPGNFAHFYTHYKPASALEYVKDPHNFLLSILTQYGPIGLIGFLAMIFMPLWAVSSPRSVSFSSKALRPEPAFKKLAIILAIIVSATLLFIRPIVFPLPTTASPQERRAAIIILYVMPVIVFIAGFLLVAAGAKRTKKSHTSITAAALLCAVLGVTLHNLIDFAIFEPGVFTAFWAIIACLIALDFHQKSRTQVVLKPAPFVKVIGVVVSLALIWAYFNYALIPVAKAGAKIALAMRDFRYAHELLDKAAREDPLDPAALNLNGRLYLQQYKETEKKQPALLRKAEECFLAASKRDKVDFKNFEKLIEVYNLLAEISPQQEKADWLNKASDSAWRAVERYPGSGRLWFELAKIAEQLGKTDVAVKHYEEAIDIEDKYRLQFQEMYPGQEIFSRLGEEKYKNAKERIEFLSQQSAL